MKIEEGEVYLDREGGRHGPIEKGEQWPNGPWLFRAGSDYYDVKGCSFNRMGKKDYEPWLVSLWEEEDKSPIGEVIHREIISGEYSGFTVKPSANPHWVRIGLAVPSSSMELDANHLRKSANLFSQLADFLEEQGK